MNDTSIGALVPSVSTTKPDPPRHPPPPTISMSEMTDAAAEAPAETSPEAQAAAVDENLKSGGLDKDLLCPICMGLIKDAFLTACGHSFCYMCVITHLNNKSDCPCCGHYLTKNQLFPNFLLNKLLKTSSVRQIAKTASPIEHLKMSLQQGCEMSIKDLDNLITLLGEKKQKMEQHEAETNMQILLEFLHCLRKQKLDELNEVQTDLRYIKEDINAVERHRIELYRARERYSLKLRMLHDDSYSTKMRSSTNYRQNNIHVSSSYGSQGGACSENFQGKKPDLKIQGNYQGNQKKESFSGSDSQHSLTQSGLAVARKRRVHAQNKEPG